MFILAFVTDRDSLNPCSLLRLIVLHNPIHFHTINDPDLDNHKSSRDDAGQGKWDILTATGPESGKLPWSIELMP